MTQPYTVAKVSEIPPGTRKIVEVNGRSIGIFNLNKEFYALRNVCPHQGADVCKGLITGYVVSSGPGHIEFDQDGEILRCPWHQWEFDIKTGSMMLDSAMRIKSYDVTIERFDVSVEEGNVIVHM